MNEYFDEYIMKLQCHRASVLLDKLRGAEMSNEKVLVTEKEGLEFTKARLISAIAFTKQLLSSGNITDMALLRKQASEQLRSLASFRKQHDVSVSFCLFEQKGEPLDCNVNTDK